MKKLSHKTLFLLDMDGTIYLGCDLFPCTLPFLDKVRKNGGRVLFLTNNSSKNKSAYIDKLARMGVSAREDDFVTSVGAAVSRLRKEQPGKLFYVCGTESLKTALKNAGILVADTPCAGVQGLLCGFDTELTFQKLDDCCRLLAQNPGLPFYATNPDWVCPTEYGYVPDCGSVCEMLFRATGRRPVFVGKPQPDMIFEALRKTNTPPQNALLVGDRLYTDVASALNAGIDAAFVLSGEGTLADIEKTGVHPTFVYKDLGELSEDL